MIDLPMKFGSGESQRLSPDSPSAPPNPWRYYAGLARAALTSPMRLPDLARAPKSEQDLHSWLSAWRFGPVAGVGDSVYPGQSGLAVAVVHLGNCTNLHTTVPEKRKRFRHDVVLVGSIDHAMVKLAVDDEVLDSTLCQRLLKGPAQLLSDLLIVRMSDPGIEAIGIIRLLREAIKPCR